MRLGEKFDAAYMDCIPAGDIIFLGGDTNQHDYYFAYTEGEFRVYSFNYITQDCFDEATDEEMTQVKQASSFFGGVGGFLWWPSLAYYTVEFEDKAPVYRAAELINWAKTELDTYLDIGDVSKIAAFIIHRNNQQVYGYYK